jgi:hypothetical protein
MGRFNFTEQQIKEWTKLEMLKEMTENVNGKWQEPDNNLYYAWSWRPLVWEAGKVSNRWEYPGS